MKKVFLIIAAIAALMATLTAPPSVSAEPVLSGQEWQRAIDAESGNETFTLPRGAVSCAVSYHEHLVRLAVQQGDEILHLGYFTRAGVQPAGEPVKGDVLAAFRALGCHTAVTKIASKSHRCDYMMIVAPYGPRQYEFFRCTRRDE